MQKLPPRPASEVGDRSGLQLERTNLYSPSTLSPEFTQKINFTNIQGAFPGTHLEALRCVIRLVQEYLGEVSIFQRKLRGISVAGSYLRLAFITFYDLFFTAYTVDFCSGNFSVSLERKSDYG